MASGADRTMTSPHFTRAAVFHGPQHPLEIQTLPLPDPTEGQVLVRILCTTVCGSDLHSVSGRRSSPAPSILGHEMVGQVIAVGAGGAREYGSSRAIVPGDRISWSMVWSCGTCFYCSRQLRPKCERLMKFGHERTGSAFPLMGGFAEHCLLPAGTAIFPVPDNVPDEVASPANCATATVAAMFRTAPGVEGQPVVVYGAGMLGLTACAMARERNAASVLAIDTDPNRRDLAARFGADCTLDGGGREAAIVFDLTGHPDAMEAGFEMLRPGGCLILAGAVFPSRALAISAEQIVRRMIRIEGVYNYAPEDLGVALAFLSRTAGRYPFRELVQRTFPLHEINEAIAYAEQHKPPRVAIRTDPSRLPARATSTAAFR